MPFSQDLGDPTYRCELGGGLVLRWSTAADKAGCILVSYLAMGMTEGQEEEFGVRYIEPHTDDAFYAGSPTNWATCVDTSPLEKPATPSDSPTYVDNLRAEADSAQERVVALVYFLTAEYSFDGDAARVPVGRARIVACKPAYRQGRRIRENIVKALFDMVHGHRIHGYEHAIDMGRGLITHLSALRPYTAPGEGAPAPFALRPATLADLPELERLVTAPRAAADIFAGVAAPVLRAQLRWLLGERPAAYIFPVHFFFVLEKRDAPDTALRIVAAAGLLNPRPRSTPFSGMASKTHLPLQSPSWAGVPSLPAFLRAISPALTARVAHAAPILGANYTGTLRFAGGIVLRVAAGTVSIEEDGDRDTRPTLTLPRGALVQLLLGYASLSALQVLLPDAAADSAVLPLMEVLFPQRQGVGSTMLGAYYFIEERMVFK
ncbi:hypothetical protein FB451DRAFT_1486183 [Mycena latifolia]|nr:hypothetical protein FB451DRAFT_1486183 [Mycena latifolia]